MPTFKTQEELSFGRKEFYNHLQLGRNHAVCESNVGWQACFLMGILKPLFRALLLVLVSVVCAKMKAQNSAVEGLFNLPEIRDTSTLETKVIQDWKPMKGDPEVRQKLIEITVCEWWPEQKVRLPVTLSAPANGKICTNLLVANQGLAPKTARLNGAQLDLLKNHGVGVVLIGMGTIDAMEPKAKLHLGMRRQLLKTKNPRYSAAWIWGMSDMRALTAAAAEADVFRPEKVLATGGSKRGVGATVAGIFDERFTAILPVVAPMLGNPGGAYIIGTEKESVTKANEKFLQELVDGKWKLPDTTKAALDARAERRRAIRVTLKEAKAAGWTKDDIATMGDKVWDACRITDFLPGLKKRGLEIFFNVGTNDSVSPALLELGKKYPDFPVCIIPGGQHGGPTDAGFARQVPKLPSIQSNFASFAKHHFFGARRFPAQPKIESNWNAATRSLKVTVQFPDKTINPETNELWWNYDRSEPYTLPFEYDQWQSMPLTKTGGGKYEGEIVLTKRQPKRSVDVISLHTHTENSLPLTISSRYHRVDFSKQDHSKLVDEDFSSNAIPANWQSGGRKGSWSVVDGALRGVAQPGDSHGPSIGLPISGHDLQIEFDFRYATKEKGYFLFLVDGDSQFQGQAHLLRFSAAGKQVQLAQDRGDPASKQAQKKERDKNGGKRIPATKEQLADPGFYRIESLAKHTATPADGEWHHVRIAIHGNHVSAQLDDQEKLSAKATVLDVPKSRIVFLVGQEGDVRIDDVVVTEIR